MQRKRARLLPLALGAALAGAPACARHPRYPVTHESVPFTALDATETHTAPDVAGRVTAERIARAASEPQNWLTYYGTYDGQRFSALDQVTTGNVRSLQLAWQFQAGVIGLVATPATYAFEATPIVVDGVMYVSGWDGYVWALDAATGKLFWRYRHAVPLDVPLCCGNVNRGVAVAQGKVFFATPHGHVVALDARTGAPVWDTPFVDVRAGESVALVVPSVVAPPHEANVLLNPAHPDLARIVAPAPVRWGARLFTPGPAPAPQATPRSRRRR
jgi:glucose dehydrogenase